jgi:integrase
MSFGEVDFDEGPARIHPIPWERFRREVLAAYQPPLRAAATLRFMSHACDVIEALTAVDDAGEPVLAPGGTPVRLVQTTADLDARMIARVLATRPESNKPATVRSLLIGLRTMCNSAVESGYLRVSPFRRNPVGKLVRVGRPRGRRHLTRQEIRALLDTLAAAPPATKGWIRWKAQRLHALVALVAYTGLRRNEALMLHVEDVDLARRVIVVRPRVDHRLKTEASADDVPMPDALVPLLTDWLAHRLDAPPGFEMPAEVPWLFPQCRRRGPWTGGNADDSPLGQLKAAGRRAKIGDINWQMLRRSLATHLRHFGASNGTVGRILRHSVDVDEEFYHETDLENLRAAVRRVEF